MFTDLVRKELLVNTVNKSFSMDKNGKDISEIIKGFLEDDLPLSSVSKLASLYLENLRTFGLHDEKILSEGLTAFRRITTNVLKDEITSIPTGETRKFLLTGFPATYFVVARLPFNDNIVYVYHAIIKGYHKSVHQSDYKVTSAAAIAELIVDTLQWPETEEK